MLKTMLMTLGIMAVCFSSNKMALPTHAFALVRSSPSSSSSMSSSSAKPTYQYPFGSTTSPSTELFGKKVKPGSMASIVSEEGSGDTGTGSGRIGVKQRSPRNSNKRRSNDKKASSSNKKLKNGDTSISPALTEWIATNDIVGGDDNEKAVIEKAVLAGEENNDEGDISAVSFEQFEEPSSSTGAAAAPGNSRRIKQSVRMELESSQNAQIKGIVNRFEEVLKEKSANIDTILKTVQLLLDVPSPLPSSSGSGGGASLRQLLTGKRRLDYRLAWAGSDEAICHVGTGLHKVALARLQEVFLSCLGRNRLELVEVIRILGPFPNVKNTLQGNAKVAVASYGVDDSNNLARMQIAMDSMVDGTGKEILAGKEENIRRVDLHILYCDENAIVAVVPPKDGTSIRSDPLEDNGAHVLVFVKEDELDEKLEALRVS